MDKEHELPFPIYSPVTHMTATNHVSTRVNGAFESDDAGHGPWEKNKKGQRSQGSACALSVAQYSRNYSKPDRLVPSLPNDVFSRASNTDKAFHYSDINSIENFSKFFSLAAQSCDVSHLPPSWNSKTSLTSAHMAPVKPRG